MAIQKKGEFSSVAIHSSTMGVSKSIQGLSLTVCLWLTGEWRQDILNVCNTHGSCEH